MAERDFSDLRTVTNVTPEAADQTVSVLAGMGQQIIQQSMEAKLHENMSKAQLEVNALNNQYQIDYEGEPFGGLDAYKEQRQQIFDKYGEGISPFVKRQWDQGTFELSEKADVGMQTWGYQQSRTNTIQSIKSTIETDLTQAMINGQGFAKSGSSDFSSFLDYATARQRIEQSATGKIGQETVDKLMNDYQNDYLKTFLSGVADTNPSKALNIMGQDKIKESFNDPLHYLQMKDAFTARAKRFEAEAQERQALKGMKGQNDIFSQSLKNPMNYADLQQQMGAHNITGPAAEFFLKMNGFAAGEKKLTQDQQLNYKAELYNTITSLGKEENLTTSNISALQGAIYTGMNTGALTEKEGMNYINQLVEPLAAQKEEKLGKFGQGSWNPFQDNIGFDGVQDYYKNNIEMKPAEGEEATGPQTTAINNANKVKLYDYYLGALQADARALGVDVTQIDSLPSKTKQQLYSGAQTQAQKLFMQDRTPALRTLPDMPNYVLENGKLIPGLAGERQLNAVAKAQPTFKFQKDDKTGMIYRVFQNGKKEFYSDGSVLK